MAKLWGGGAFELRKDPSCEHLAEFHAPLIEAVDVPHHPLGEDAVFVKGDERAEDRWGEAIVEDRARGNVAGELPMGNEPGRCPLGGHLLNDIGALPDGRNAALCAAHGTALLVMHSVGLPKQAHTHVGYPDIMAELERFFEEKLALCAAHGLPRDAILLDPGIDFAKQRQDNLTIFRGLHRLKHFQRPILLPISRKTVIGEVLGLPNPLDRDAATLACLASGLSNGAHLFRVHRVRPAAEANKVLWALQAPAEEMSQASVKPAGN